MNNFSDKCNVCGGTEKTLFDGFYYCAECGTQDDKLQETIVEYVIQDGMAAEGLKKKIRKEVKHEPEVRMSDSWYRWHGYNFILFGVADELIKLGANPSFKTKLLWVWTKYMKAYMNPEEFGLVTDEKKEESANEMEKEQNENNSDCDSEESNHEYILDRYHYSKTRKVKTPSLRVLITIIYIALNIDESPLQEYHLIRYLRESRLSIPYKLKNLIPQEMRPNLLQKSYTFVPRFLYLRKEVDTSAMTLFKNLNLGTPVVPDLRLIVEDFLDELCLPHTFKPLILSLMDFFRCEYMDLTVQEKYIDKMPKYQAECMVFIIVAIKLCFGLDDEYEVKLSEAVNKINEQQKYHKVHTLHNNSAQTNRLFSYTEWCNYMRFRNNLLEEHCVYLGYTNGGDMDVYVAVEQAGEAEDEEKKDLKDEITANIVNNIPGGELRYGVIPRNNLKPTRTPYATYTQVLIDHLQDPELKLALSEDFRQYSVDYVAKDLRLIDPDSNNKENLIAGIDKTNKIVKGGCISKKSKKKKYLTNMVYVRNCDNHNWTKTSGPTGSHMNKVSALYSDLEEDRTAEPEPKRRKLTKKRKKYDDSDEDDAIIDRVVIEVVDDDDKSVASEIENPKRRNIVEAILSQAPHKETEKEEEFQTIEEEDEGVNIFDDNFADLNETKIEPVDNDTHANDVPNGDNIEMFNNTFNDNADINNGYESDASSIDSINLNLNNFDRNQVIKDLVMFACKKYSIPVPQEYKGSVPPRAPRQEDRRNNDRRQCPDTKKQAQNLKAPLISAYYEQLRQDALLNISSEVRTAIENANRSIQNPVLDNGIQQDNNTSYEVPIEGPSRMDDDRHSMEGSVNETSSVKVKDKSDSENEKLFNESSDEETYGKQFLPEKHPNFDEDIYDSSQLYLKVAPPKEVPEIEVNEELVKIVKRKMKKDNDTPSLLSYTKERRHSRSDSEDDMPLSDIKYLMDNMKSYSKPKNIYKPLINEKVEVPEYNYWSKLYLSLMCLERKTSQKDFQEYLNEMPKSFEFLIKCCSKITGLTPIYLCKKLQKVEMMMFEKCGHIDLK